MNESWQESGGAKISCAGPDHLISGQPTAVANGKLICSIRSSNSSGSQKAHRLAATLSSSGCRIEANRNTTARAEDQPVILDNDDDLDKARAGGQAEGASGEVDTGRIELDASLHNSFPTSELASAPTDSIDTSDPWYDVEEGRYVEETAPGPGSHEQHSVPSAPAQVQALQGQIHQQDETWLNWRKNWGWLWESNKWSHHRPHTYLPKSSSAEAPQDDIQSRERSETTGSRPEELRDACRCGTSAQGLEWEQRETWVAVESLGRRELGEEAVMEETGRVEVNDTDDRMDKEATEALPATQLEIDKLHFRLRGIRTQQLPGRQTKTTRYRVVWGEHPNTSDSWVNGDDVQISMPRLPCERSSQDLVPQVEKDVVRVHHIRSSRRSKCKKIFEYLVDEISTWIPEDRLRISLSPTLLAGLKASSTDPLSLVESEVHSKHLAILANDEHCHASRTPRSHSTASTPPGPARNGDPDAEKRGGKRAHQDLHAETGSETHSMNTDDSHNTGDSGIEDLRLAKRRKPRAALAMALTTCRRHSSDSLATLWCHQPPDLRLTTRSPRLMLDVRRPSSMTSSTVSHELLGVPLRQQRRYQSLSIRNGPSKDSSSAPGSGMM
ncbi:hypothetical protein DL98DRAFT_639498 [Cadophora sp. DSE1049]|nr:hypothetical protein DL98DRAFT_639498 [Cadophora sp. DSE1049]